MSLYNDQSHHIDSVKQLISTVVAEVTRGMCQYKGDNIGILLVEFKIG